MKKVFLFTVALSIMATLFLSSCATYQNDLFSKRKYYNFPRSKHIVSNQSEELVINKIKPTVISSITTRQEDEKKSEVTASVNQHTRPAVKKEIKAQALKKGEKSNLQTIEKGETKTSPAPKNFLNKTIESQPSSASDEMLILLIILALLLPPLAVYLKNNKAVNQWFWITLILSLLSVLGWGFWIGGLAGILWFVAAVIAILYVFDMI